MTMTAIREPKKTHELDLSHISQLNSIEVGETFSSFLDIAGTTTGRATFYNTKDEQASAALEIHTKLFSIDRGIYGLTLLLPGVTDYARQMGLSVLLDQPYKDPSVLTSEQEGKLISYLIRQLPPQRMLKMFGEFRKKRINNARTRKLILRSILNSNRLEFWSVKYRSKMRNAIEHAWGKRMTGIIRSILNKPSKEHNAKERSILVVSLRSSLSQIVRDR